MTLWLIVIPLLPLLLALCLVWPNLRRGALALAPWTPFPALLLSLSGISAPLELPWLLLGVRLALDATAQVFLLFTALLWWIAGLYARRYFTSQQEQLRFFAYFLPAMAGNLGLVMAQDMFSFLSCYALMSFAAYGLVIHRGDEAARRAGLVYLVLVVIGEVLLFAGLLLYADKGMGGAVPAVLLFLGFGIKAGALPLHVWLPLAHPAAPTPASAVLSGAMIKAGLLGWLRFLSLGPEAQPAWGEGVMWLGMAAALGGAVIGFTQRNPKTLLAYSSISQMGLMTVIVGFGLAVPAAREAVLAAAAFYALHHALAKGGLFLGVGMADLAQSRREGRWVMGGMALCALAMAGLPLTGGALAKLELKALLLSTPDTVGIGILPLLSVSTIATTLLMGRLLWLVHKGIGAHAGSVSSPWGSWGLLLLCVLLTGEAGRHWPAADLASQLTWGNGWPLLLGVLLFLPLLKRMPVIRPLPAGDLLLIYTLLLRRLDVGRQWVEAGIIRAYVRCRAAFLWFSQRLQTGERVITGGEAMLRLWAVGATLMVLMLAGLLLLMQ